MFSNSIEQQHQNMSYSNQNNLINMGYEPQQEELLGKHQENNHHSKILNMDTQTAVHLSPSGPLSKRLVQRHQQEQEKAQSHQPVRYLVETAKQKEKFK